MIYHAPDASGWSRFGGTGAVPSPFITRNALFSSDASQQNWGRHGGRPSKGAAEAGTAVEGWIPAACIHPQAGEYCGPRTISIFRLAFGDSDIFGKYGAAIFPVSFAQGSAIRIEMFLCASGGVSDGVADCSTPWIDQIGRRWPCIDRCAPPAQISYTKKGQV